MGGRRKGTNVRRAYKGGLMHLGGPGRERKACTMGAPACEGRMECQPWMLSELKNGGPGTRTTPILDWTEETGMETAALGLHRKRDSTGHWAWLFNAILSLSVPGFAVQLRVLTVAFPQMWTVLGRGDGLDD